MIIKCSNQLGQSQTGKKINSLAYEISLLKERNLILSQQNQLLVNTVQNMKTKLLETKQSIKLLEQANKQLNNQSNGIVCMVNQKIKLLQQIINDADKQNKGHAHNQFKILTQCFRHKFSLKTTIQSLFDILNQYAQNQPSKKEERAQKLKKMKQLMEKRKQYYSEKRFIEKQALHIVKHPNLAWNQSQFSFNRQIEAIMRLYEKTIMRIKHKDINNQSLCKILGSIRQIYVMKKQVEQLYKEVSQLQRQIELGRTSIRVIQSSSQLLNKAQSKYIALKRQICQQIQSL